MKQLLVGMAVLALAGCAASWKGYSEEHQCLATEKTLRKPEVVTSSGGLGSWPATTPGTELRYSTFRLYHCANGSIWGPL